MEEENKRSCALLGDVHVDVVGFNGAVRDVWHTATCCHDSVRCGGSIDEIGVRSSELKA